MGILFSQEFNVQDEVEELGIFDAIIDSDSPFFINIKRLQYTKVEEFQEAYDKINTFFRSIGLLLKTATSREHKNYRTAYRMFHFPEVNGINLGFSHGRRGSGLGPELRAKIISDAYDIIKTGSEQPEIFHLCSLFEENIGPDRLSDMIAHLVYDNILNYTKHMYRLLNLTPDTIPEYKFKDGLLVNPYKPCPILLLPKDILHEIPIARGWDDIDRVCRENEAIRAEINEEVTKEWTKLSSGMRKEYLRETIFKNPEKLKKVIEAYDKTTIDELDLDHNSNYLVEKILALFEEKRTIAIESSKDSFEASLEIINEFKHWVEEQKGYMVYQTAKTSDMEKVVQRTLHGSAAYYCKTNGLDISPESNTGRGPVDFKISRGTDKTVIEIKLSTNNDCLHGFDVQIEEYAKSEQTTKKIFLLVDNNGPRKNIDTVIQSYEDKKASGQCPAEVVIIDARPKDSASKYIPKK